MPELPCPNLFSCPCPCPCPCPNLFDTSDTLKLIGHGRARAREQIRARARARARAREKIRAQARKLNDNGNTKMINENDQTNEFPLSDANDVMILMHRDVHFGGKFDLMLQYYENEGKGVVEEIEIDRIRELQTIEKEADQNLAALLLTGSDAEKIAHAKAAYKRLRSIYENNKSTPHQKLIADLILTEDENPKAEIAAIVAEKGTIIPALLELVRSEEFHDPLYPGYGHAPQLATQCLGLIGDKRAIITLFEELGSSDFFDDDLAIEALKMIGKPAKEFLLKVLHGKPYTFDNERAAMALLQFEDDPDVPEACLKLLQELNLKKDSILASYLIYTCEGLKDPAMRQQLLALADRSDIPPSLVQDIKTVAKSWKMNPV